MAVEEKATPSEQTGIQDFLDSVQGELALFRAVMHARPIGIHRHFHMLAIVNNIRKDTGVLVSSDDVWRKLQTLYDMDALEDLEIDLDEEHRSIPFEANLAGHPFFREEFSIFNLPAEYDLYSLVSKRRERGSPSTASPPPEELIPPPSTTKPKRQRRKSVLPPPTPAKKEVVSAGLVRGESVSSALTENTEMEIDVEGDPMQVEPPETRSRASNTISTPRTPVPEEDEEIEVASPAPSTASKPSNKRTRKTAPPVEKRTRQSTSKGTRRRKG